MSWILQSWASPCLSCHRGTCLHGIHINPNSKSNPGPPHKLPPCALLLLDHLLGSASTRRKPKLIGTVRPLDLNMRLIFSVAIDLLQLHYFQESRITWAPKDCKQSHIRTQWGEGEIWPIRPESNPRASMPWTLSLEQRDLFEGCSESLGSLAFLWRICLNCTKNQASTF